MKKGRNFELFETYPICAWSGQLGPKLKEGDAQAPEGFYTIGKGQLNPNSHYHRAFNLGYPNMLDRAYNRTGSNLMVHGGCGSIGCYAMTDAAIGELWLLVTAALDAGQERAGVHVFPFRMTEERLAAFAWHPWAEFWRDLKPAYDLFEETHIPPQIGICNKRYTVQRGHEGTGSAPALQSLCPSNNWSARQSRS
jgi:murein L,D-transpeptidase YafK